MYRSISKRLRFVCTILLAAMLTTLFVGGNATRVMAATSYVPVQLQATGIPPITWAIISGSLPPGLTLDSSTGIISGTPTTPGTYTFTARATNPYGSDTKQLSITIYPAKPVINSFAASPATISPGQSSTLSWSTTGSASISIDQGLGTQTGTSVSVSPAVSTPYTITVTGAGGTVTETIVVRVQLPCTPGTPQATAMPIAAPTDTNLFKASDQAISSLTAAINNSTLTIPVAGNAGSAGTGTTVPSEIGLLFMNPKGFAESDASAVVFPAKSPSTGASATAQKIMHGRFHIFMPADQNTWSWFPYTSFQSYAATEAGLGHPLFVTATYAGKSRPVYFSPSLALDGSNKPTTPSSNWRQLVKVDDPAFINFWVQNYVNAIAWSQVSGQQHLWMGLDECYFIWNTFGVLDDSGVFQNVTSFDSPFPANESQLISMLASFFTQLKTIAPNIPVMPNLASGISDIMLDDPTQFAALYKDAQGVMVENIYTPTATSDFSRSQFYANLYNIYNFGAGGKTALLRANIASATDTTGSRTALITYLLMRGSNFFYAPNIGLNPSTNITAEDPANYKPMWDAIGEPSGALTSTQIGATANDRLYSRTTNNGIIYLNWTGSSQTVTLPTGTWVDRNGNPVTTLTIPDVTGDYALLKNPPSGSGTTSPFVPFQIVTIDSEQMKLCSVSATALTVCSGGRGFAGTTAASHTSGAPVGGRIGGVYHNQAVAELIAAQTWISSATHHGTYPGTSLLGASWPGHIATVPELYWMTDYAQELLTAALSQAATSGTVSNGACYHSSQIVLSDNELFEVGSVSSNTLSGLTRGIGGTTAGSHAIGASVFGVIATPDWNRLMTELAATESDLYGNAGSTQSGICGTSCTAATGVSWPNHAVTTAELSVAGNGSSLTASMWNRFVAEMEAFIGDIKAHP